MSHVRFVVITLLLVLGNGGCLNKTYRPSLHAGTWYPGNEKELREAIEGYLASARPRMTGRVCGLVAPHAGYVYSGPVAAYAYRLIRKATYDAVIIIGPSHYHGFTGVSVDTLAGRETPLGRVDFALDLVSRLIAASPRISYVAQAHAEEHSTEIQVPFIQTVLDQPRIVEIVMGEQDWQTCLMLADAITNAAQGMNVLVIASSDLSHFHDQGSAERLDDLVVKAVADFAPDVLSRLLAHDSCEACGGGPIVTTMLVARAMGAQRAIALRYATSGDVTGDYHQVVGYLSAAFVKTETEERRVGIDLGFTDAEKTALKDLARAAVESAVKGIPPAEFTPASERLKEHYGAFVTITKHGDLRGCIGRIIGDQPLYLTIQQMAQAAAMEDPRFRPVEAAELPELEIEISVLTPLEEVKDVSAIVIGRDGLVIRSGYHSGLLLPQVATDYGWDVEEFLAQTCQKAGLPRNAYLKKDAKIYKFSAEVF